MVSYRADELSVEVARIITQNHLDITGAAHVEIIADKKRGTLHINVNGVCAVRVCRILSMDAELHGFRKPKAAA